MMLRHRGGSLSYRRLEHAAPKMHDGSWVRLLMPRRTIGRRAPIGALTFVLFWLGAGLSVLAMAADPIHSARKETMAAFGAEDVTVRSVQVLDVDAFNVRTERAAEDGESWAREAILVALKFSGEGLLGSSKRIEVNTPPERFDSALITITESGYLDDSVAGIRYRLWLGRGPSGTWKLKKALRANLCSRPDAMFYSAEPCP
jgi:hypothetical protein